MDLRLLRPNDQKDRPRVAKKTHYFSSLGLWLFSFDTLIIYFNTFIMSVATKNVVITGKHTSLIDLLR
jgi:hypothetical protein